MSPLPSKLLKTWSSLTRWLLASVVLAWLLFGLAWGALHWVIVPRIGEFRPQLEQRATQALGLRVRIGAVVAQSNGMVPSFELTEVTLLDAQDRVALRLPRVLIAASPRSLWRFGFEQIYIDQPQLDIRRDQDGKITIGGLDFADPRQADTAAMDWFFSQLEFAIHNGTVRWTDEQRAAEPLLLQNVAVLVRNRGRHHDLRMDATPPEALGSRFSMSGKFLQPLLSRRHGQWQDWEGQLYAAIERADLSQLRHYLPLGVELNQGRGALRTWVDVAQGQVTQVQADVALSEVQVVLGQTLQALALQQVQGRLGGRRLPHGFEFFTQSMTFDTADGLHWPGGMCICAWRRRPGSPNVENSRPTNSIWRHWRKSPRACRWMPRFMSVCVTTPPKARSTHCKPAGRDRWNVRKNMRPKAGSAGWKSMLSNLRRASRGLTSTLILTSRLDRPALP